MVEPSQPLKTDFDSLENLFERMARKVNVKLIVDQMD